MSIAGEDPRSYQDTPRWLGRELARHNAPLRNCGGIDKNGNLPADDASLLDKTRYVRKKGERLIELIARVGISPAQIRELSSDEIKKFVERAEEAERDSWHPTPPSEEEVVVLPPQRGAIMIG